MNINTIKLKFLNIEFFKNNYLYIIWCIIYFIATWVFFGAGLGSFFFVTLLYAVSLTIAFSPLGEQILRLVNRVRRLETNREKEYLIPIFEDVYTEAKKADPKLRTDIEICIIDAMYINARALGRKTIAVTKGAIESLSEEELKGFIAHELGHIANGDTKATLLTTVGNGIFTVFVIISKTIVNAIDCLLDRRGFAGFITFLTKLVFNLILFLFVYIGEVILSINSRRNEYRADVFAYNAGYGNDLVSALYLLQGMCISDNTKLVDKLKASHPNIAKRIGRLESIIDNAGQV